AVVSALSRALLAGGSIARSAADALGNIGPGAQAAVPALRDALKLPGVSESVARALWRVDRQSQPLVHMLLRDLKDADHETRAGAAISLGEIAVEAEITVPALIEALKDKEDSVPTGAAEGLGKIAPAGKTAIPALIEALKDHRAHVPARASAALGRFGPAAKAALPELGAARRRIAARAKRLLAIARIDTSDAMAWGETIEAIWRIGGQAEEVVPELIVFLETLHFCAGEMAAKILALTGSQARTAVQAIARLLKQRGNFELQKAAAVALGSIGPDAWAAVPALIKVLGQERIGPAAAAALKKIDPDAAAKLGIR